MTYCHSMGRWFLKLYPDYKMQHHLSQLGLQLHFCPLSLFYFTVHVNLATSRLPKVSSFIPSLLPGANGSVYYFLDSLQLILFSHWIVSSTRTQILSCLSLDSQHLEQCQTSMYILKGQTESTTSVTTSSQAELISSFSVLMQSCAHPTISAMLCIIILPSTAKGGVWLIRQAPWLT